MSYIDIAPGNELFQFSKLQYRAYIHKFQVLALFSQSAGINTKPCPVPGILLSPNRPIHGNKPITKPICNIPRVYNIPAHARTEGQIDSRGTASILEFCPLTLSARRNSGLVRICFRSFRPSVLERSICPDLIIRLSSCSFMQNDSCPQPSRAIQTAHKAY